MEKKLKELSLRLLDLGKRNRLLNFKDTTYRTLEILNPNIDLIFEKITNGQTLNFFPIDSVLKKYNETIEGNDVLVSEYSKGKVIDIVKDTLRPNDILGYKKGVSLTKVLKVLYKEYNNVLSEKGINPLYLSFGLVEYEDNKTFYKAPLLLVPINLIFEKENYRIKEYEDEVILNPTLAYMLKTEYKVILDEYDDSNLISYFSKVKTILESNNLKFYNHIGIGIYSFLKMNMFNDLTNNKDIVLQNENVLRILGKNIETENYPNLPVFPVVNADESQLAAITYATCGNSFVLQGPPGSGKSQTITNIISSMIGNGKKVLFVSEKQAALNVVYENLKRAGLESFSLELHSHKANKKEFIEELYKTAILPKYDISTDVESIKSDYLYSKSILEGYRKEIHTKINQYNLSLYELYSLYLKCDKSVFSYEIKDISTLNINDLKYNKNLLDKYYNLSSLSSYDYRKNCFYGIKNCDLSFVKYQAQDTLNSYYSFFGKVSLIKKKINNILPVNINTLNELLDSLVYVEKISKLKTYKKEYFNINKRKKIIQLLDKYLKSSSYIEKSTIFNFFTDTILDEDIELLINDLTMSLGIFKFFKPTYHKCKKTIKKYVKYRMNDYELIDKLKEVLEYKKCKENVSFVTRNMPKDYDIASFKDIYDDLNLIKDFNIELRFDDVEFKNIKNEFIDILIHFQQLDGIPKFDDVFSSEVFNLTDSIDLLFSKITNMVNNINQLENYVNLLNTVKLIEENNILEYLHKSLDLNVKLIKLSSFYESSFYENIILKQVHNSAFLREIKDLGIENTIKEFKKLDEIIYEMNKAIIVSKLSKERPDDNIMAGSFFSILVKEYNKTRKQKPIRVLLSEILDLILSIKPVFLMSPLSVSTYLNSSLNMFDVVIFDEASQVFSWDAVGAIYRAKQCIIIGDSKQMPPSNFFNTISEDEESSLDVESILDKGMTIFNTKQLCWHYRSRSEELIDFSNRKFYDSRLITVPQAKKHNKDFGVDFCYVNGRYETNLRTNKIEASYVVDLIVDHYKNNNEKSLGVVAFSNLQAELIEELLEERLASNPELELELKKNNVEPFFIKNLETVQGDERDVIIFSICYGYNNDNKFYQRFGPLNNVGGERRLNVAVTRAKYNIKVVSSIKSSDISLDNTESLGVKLLKEYLEYAENSNMDLNLGNKDIDGIALDIVNTLKEEGYMVQTNIGKSSFKVDIAVMHPLTREYMVSIMLDGNSYNIGNCSDVNRLQELLLNRLGWKYYRVFSTLWVLNKDEEKNKLINFINLQLDVKEEKKEEKKIDFLVENEFELESSFMEYPYTTDEEITKLYGELKVSELIEYIVKKEEPISIDFLLKRICFVYGRTKVTNVVKKLFEDDLKELDLINKDGYLSTKIHTNLSLRLNSNRTIEQVHSLELQDAIFSIVKKSNGIEKDSCFKLVAKLLGYSRMSDNAYSYLENALVFLMLEGKIIEKENRLYI